MQTIKKLNRRLLLAALSSGILFFSGTAVVAAQSNVTIYGQVDAYVAGVKTIGQEQRTWAQGGGGMQTSFLGIKGTENLGGSLRAIFMLESYYRPDTGGAGRYNGDAFFSRGAYVGLQGDWGSIKLGRIATPYWISTISFNPFGSSFVFSPAIYQSYFGNGSVAAPLLGDSAWSNSAMYTSPTFSGFTANVLYAFGEAPGDSGKKKMGGNLMYNQGPVAATLAYQEVDFSATPSDLGPAFDKQRAVFAGVSYNFEVAKVFGHFQQLDNKLSSGDLKRNSGQLGVSVPLAGGSVLASYAYMKTTGTTENNRRSWALGYDYPLSKRTDIYSAYYRDSVTGLSAGDTLGFGIRHYF